MSKQELNKIIDFIQNNLPYHDRELIRQYIEQHEGYKTCDYEFDEQGEIIYIARWNITGRTVFVLDFAVRKEYRSKGFIRYVLLKNLRKHLPLYPFVRFIQWRRGSKYPERKEKVYSIHELLKKEMASAI